MGFFIYIKPNTKGNQDVIVRKWNEEDQLFEKVPEADELAFAEATRNMDFDGNLGAYPIQNL